MNEENQILINQWEQDIRENIEILKHNKKVLRLHKICYFFISISFLAAFYVPIYLISSKRFIECFIILLFIFWFKNYFKLSNNVEGL